MHEESFGQNLIEGFTFERYATLLRISLSKLRVMNQQ